MNTIMNRVRDKVIPVWEEHGLMNETITVMAGPLTVEQAIGTPDGEDFPIQKGKEKLMEACFRDERGQAFTDHYGNYSGTLAQVVSLPLDNNFHRAVFVATLNAVSRSLGKAENTVHCKDCGPKDCAQKLPAYIREKYGNCRITQVGLQPAMAEALNVEFELRLLDLDPDNIGQVKRGVLVEGQETAAEALEWADLLLVTGTTFANGTIDPFLSEKPVLFYGTTIAGASSVMGWERFCPQST
ncbi:Rossmann-like domain-containing protein [Salidesulfovibrio onnuriiensis]|uniref:Rossmann-like domain-containing protein n=1 Tax=Salidesulfovibrio onnuriiensis TaxID=2583823 RepID=UPI0011C909DF|nr:DUF364 domain-containing protein [Salidesulfovibrio onnuriiensis]